MMFFLNSLRIFAAMGLFVGKTILLAIVTSRLFRRI